MASDILAKSSADSNLNSRRHILLYQKMLYTGSQMAYHINQCDRLCGPLPEEVFKLASKWEDLMKQLTKVLLL